MADLIDPNDPENPEDEVKIVDFANALSERYLSYALSTIMARSLPDVRDGLKPVQRRLLYAMRLLKLDPKAGYKKSARVVGDVIGKFHPHGDTAIYDAMVRMAQEFAQRYTLVDGQGNFGNIDGDNAAAMRYTEARMSAVAQALLEGLDEGSVDFRPTYDGEEEEPVVLPANFPHLLANGSIGIAVGMATSIPPHNAAELIEALIYLVEHKRASVADLLQFVPGPDFPTGGVIVEPRQNIQTAYETGRGSVRLRARWEIEKKDNGTWHAVITEIPYQVQKGRLIERVAEMVVDRKLPMVGEFRDESSEEIRIIVEPKSRNIDPVMMMEGLFRQTELETRISINMNVLDKNNTPGVMSLRDSLKAFLDHRQEVLVRRSRFRLEKIEKRLHLLDGYLIAYLNIDELIRIIRFEDEPKPVMMATFGLSDIQAEAILNMRLRALHKLEEFELRKEHDELTEEMGRLNALIDTDKLQWKAIKGELKDLRDRFGENGSEEGIWQRLTSFADAPEIDDVPMEAMVEKEPITVVLSAKGWVRAMKGHGVEPDSVKYKDGDKEGYFFPAQTTDKLILLASDGRCFTMGADRLPGGRGFGEPLSLLLDMAQGTTPIAFRVHRPGEKLILASSEGHGFVVPEDELLTNQKAGKRVISVSGKAKAKAMVSAAGDHVAVLGKNRKLLIFPIDELPEMPRGKGVIMQRYKDGGLADVKAFTLAEGLTWKIGSRTRTETEMNDWLGKRASAGRNVPQGFSKTTSFS